MKQSTEFLTDQYDSILFDVHRNGLSINDYDFFYNLYRYGIKQVNILEKDITTFENDQLFCEEFKDDEDIENFFKNHNNIETYNFEFWKKCVRRFNSIQVLSTSCFLASSCTLHDLNEYEKVLEKFNQMRKIIDEYGAFYNYLYAYEFYNELKKDSFNIFDVFMDTHNTLKDSLLNFKSCLAYVKKDLQIWLSAYKGSYKWIKESYHVNESSNSIEV